MSPQLRNRKKRANEGSKRDAGRGPWNGSHLLASSLSGRTWWGHLDATRRSGSIRKCVGSGRRFVDDFVKLIQSKKKGEEGSPRFLPLTVGYEACIGCLLLFYLLSATSQQADG